MSATATATETASIKPTYLSSSSATNVVNMRKAESLKPRYKDLLEGSGSQLIILFPNLPTEAEEIGVSDVEESENHRLKLGLNKLNKLNNETNLNPNLKAISVRAYDAALKWLPVALKLKIKLAAPNVLITGDGGVAVEWRLKNNYVSIHFDESDSEMDMIFYRFGSDRNYKDLNKSNLTQLLHRLD
jgi:hypothetical protein